MTQINSKLYFLTSSFFYEVSQMLPNILRNFSRMIYLIYTLACYIDSRISRVYSGIIVSINIGNQSANSLKYIINFVT